MSEQSTSGEVDPQPVAVGNFIVTGANSSSLDEKARRIAASFADGRPHSVEIDADAVMRGTGEVVGWQARCTVTVWYRLHGVTYRETPA